MKRRKVESFEDMVAAPEGEWHEMPHGVDLEVFDETTDPPTHRLHLRLPGRVAREFSPRKGEVLRATIKDRTLTLERAPVRRGRTSRAR
jgi:hypothetical protein